MDKNARRRVGALSLGRTAIILTVAVAKALTHAGAAKTKFITTGWRHPFELDFMPEQKALTHWMDYIIPDRSDWIDD